MSHLALFLVTEIEPNEVWKGVYVRIGPIAVTSSSRIPTREVPRVSGGISVTPGPGRARNGTKTPPQRHVTARPARAGACRYVPLHTHNVGYVAVLGMWRFVFVTPMSLGCGVVFVMRFVASGSYHASVTAISACHSHLSHTLYCSTRVKSHYWG